MDFSITYTSVNTWLPPLLSPTPTQVHTCPPAMGYSFAAGTIDGPGAFDFTQGTGITGTPVTGDTSAVLHY